MAKTKTAYVCNHCGANFTKWQGQCNECNSWNTLSEIRLGSARNRTDIDGMGYAGITCELQELCQVDLAKMPRFSTGMAELNRVLGGGLVPGSAILLGGHPGAGKSTLLLQLMCHLAQQMKAVYVTGEESLQQVALRASRLQLPTKNLQMLAETDVDSILTTMAHLKPKLLVVDSIQVMHLADISSAPGSVSQVRESAARLVRFAKQTHTVLLLVGHVTKDGSLAGPKVLEHMIDCSLLLEGDHDSRYRTLRGHKNRFGAVNELGVFAMLETGLKEVRNPSSIFLSQAQQPAAGSLVMVIWEGTRPLLVELQALVDDSHFSQPRRVSVGLDQNRLAMLLAVLHRHGGLRTADQDVFVNVVGGVRVAETSADLAILLAIVSSLKNQTLSQELVVFGEVGLSSEIRPVPSGQERIREAAKHGFKRAIVPAANSPKGTRNDRLTGIDVVGVSHLQQALEALC